jgi:hypothetical protein
MQVKETRFLYPEIRWERFLAKSPVQFCTPNRISDKIVCRDNSAVYQHFLTQTGTPVLGALVLLSSILGTPYGLERGKFETPRNNPNSSNPTSNNPNCTNPNYLDADIRFIRWATNGGGP